MNVNRIKLLNTLVDRNILLPLSENLDMSDRGDSVSIEEEKIVDGIIGKPTNYELCRYSMEPISNSNKTKITYNYNFQIAGVNQWGISYSALTGVEDTSQLNSIKGFKKSFFKMDFFDKKDISSITKEGYCLRFKILEGIRDLVLKKCPQEYEKTVRAISSDA